MYNNTFGPVIGDLDGMCDKLNGGEVGGGGVLPLDIYGSLSIFKTFN